METQGVRSIKILHMGDVFLDCPFSAMSSEKSALRRAEVRDTFRRALRYAAEQEVDLVVLSGNLFDNFYATLDTLEFLRQSFAATPGLTYLIFPGSHDAYLPEGLYAVGKWPENVHIAKDEEPTLLLDTPRISVLGWAFCQKSYQGSPLARLTDLPQDKITLLAGYATDGGSEDEAPVSINGIGESGADLMLLSGRNLFDGFHRADRTTYAYSGALENSCYEEPGFGGANLLTLTPTPQGRPAIECARVDLGCRRYVVEEFDLTGVESQNEVLNRLTTVIRDRGYGKETALRAVLTGRVPVGFSVPKTVTDENLDLYAFEIWDRTLPAFDESAVARDMTVRGEVCRTLIPKMRGGTEESQRRAGYALRVALGALSSKDISKM